MTQPSPEDYEARDRRAAEERARLERMVYNYDPVTQGACTASARSHDIIGAPCGACGHTNLVHPGGQSPTVDACQICELAIAIAEARAKT